MNAARYMLLGLLMAVIAGCGGMRTGGSADLPTAPPFTIQPMYKVELKDKDLPADVKLVTGAILLRMALSPDVPKEVEFAPRGVHAIHDETFDYGGFGLRGFDLLKYEAQSTGKKSAEVEMAAVVHLKDPLGRRTSVVLDATYDVTPKKVTIHSSQARPVQPAFPKTVCFFVPETAIKTVPRGSLSSFLDWYAFAVTHAVNMTPTTAERDQRAKWDTLSFTEKASARQANPPQRFVILTFAMDRILDSGELTMGFCDSPTGTMKHTEKATFLNDGGWRIGTLGAEFALNDPEKTYYIQVKYTPDTSQSAGTVYPALVGLFSTSKNYAAHTQHSSGLAAQPQSGPLENGARFLNPKNKDDAIVIQTRLAELGFYTAGIDGAFGKGSRAALAKYKKSAGLGDNSNWDLPTQQALFSGTGQ